jgi:outer membrane protein assembly factor BamB
VYGDSIYTSSGDLGGLSKFGGSDAHLNWSIYLPQDSNWTPAVDDTYVYAYMSGTLYAIKPADGTTAFRIDDPYTFSYGGPASPVTLGNKMAYVTDGYRMFAFDLVKRQLAWAMDKLRFGQPALANNTVYVMATSNTLEARSAANGQRQWTASLPGGSNEVLYNIVVTNKHVFVGLREQTVAVDLDTHAVVWSYPMGGTLAISDRGVLYIQGLQGKLVAINLQ